MGRFHSSDEIQGRIHGRSYCKGYAGVELEEKLCDGMPRKEIVQHWEIKQMINGVKGLINHVKKSCISTKIVWAQANHILEYCWVEETVHDRRVCLEVALYK